MTDEEIAQDAVIDYFALPIWKPISAREKFRESLEEIILAAIKKAKQQDAKPILPFYQKP
jgi:hypothetical protein